MAVTVTDDRTVEDTAEAITNWLSLGSGASLEALDAIHAQGSNSIGVTISNLTVNGLVCDVGASTNVLDKHIFVWAFTTQEFDTLANGGVRIRISGDADGVANYGEWFVGGRDTHIGNKNNFKSWCVDTHKPFDITNGTVPLVSSIRSIALIWNFSTQNGRISAFVDQISHGTKITLTGGTEGAPGNSEEVAANDDSNARGMFQNVGSTIFILGRIVIGDITNNESYFSDVFKIWTFEGLKVSSSFHVIEFVGHATPVNRSTFGLLQGSGITALGFLGIRFQSEGDVPFRIDALDSNTVVRFHGCAFWGPLNLQFDRWRSVQAEDNGTGFTDITIDSNDPGSNDAEMFPTVQALNDACYWGHDEVFNEMILVLFDVKGGTWSTIFEYYNGSSWVAATDVTDQTSDFTVSGARGVTWQMPNDWAKTSVNGRTFYYIRARISDFTSSGAQPTLSQSAVKMTGRVRLEQVNVETISSNFYKMGAIVIRNGAVLRKSLIAFSNANTKEGALDLGSADPTTDSVRDITLLSNALGLLLKKDVSGDVTYNLRNFIFAGNAKDIRIDFPAGSTITLNILEGGTLSPVIDNVNGSTVIIANLVTTLINIKDSSGTNLQNVRVLLEASDGTGDFPFEESITITRSGSVATVAHTGHGFVTGDIAVIRRVNEQEYNGPKTITVTSVNEYTYAVSGSPATPATGSIICTGAIINELTDVNGDVSAVRTFSTDQPVVGVARSSSTSPRFKSFALNDTIDNVDGLTINIRLIIDE